MSLIPRYLKRRALIRAGGIIGLLLTMAGLPLQTGTDSAVTHTAAVLQTQSPDPHKTAPTATAP